MKPESENIEEKLIPYLEGVLNPKERREVEEAINTNPELAREMSELRELILELRQGFATGVKPPQEELSINEVVELSYHTGSTDKLPGTSAQKARLFCSDSGLEEYSLLRALSEEMARTTLDRENVPELPAYLRKEFANLKGEGNGKGKVLPFLKPSFASKTPSVPLWRRASGWLDRIDPKPLMASAAALVMLSLGVHLYNRPAGTPASSSANSEVASAVAQPSIAPGAIAQGMGRAASSSSSPGIEGVAVFTSDDRGLLKEQAEKLLAKKVRYTVTKDRILVAEKDVAVARDILWEDAEGKAVAMAKEEPAPRRMARTVSSAQSSSQEPVDSGPFQSQAPSTVAQGDSASSAGEGSVTVYRPAKRSDAPAAVAPKRSSGTGERRGDRGVLPSYNGDYSRNPGVELREGMGKGRAENRPAPEPAPPPSEVVLPATPSEVALPTQLERPVKASESRPPISEDRRQKLKDLAVGDAAPEGDNYQYQSVRNEASAGAPIREESAPAPAAMATSAQQQTTTVETRARVSQPSAPVSASAPAVTKVDEVDSRMARVEVSRQKVAEKNGVELSFERQDEKIVVYVRPNRALDKAQLDELRKTLRKELGLAESDTLIFR